MGGFKSINGGDTKEHSLGEQRLDTKFALMETRQDQKNRENPLCLIVFRHKITISGLNVAGIEIVTYCVKTLGFLVADHKLLDLSALFSFPRELMKLIGYRLMQEAE